MTMETISEQRTLASSKSVKELFKEENVEMVCNEVEE